MNMQLSKKSEEFSTLSKPKVASDQDVSKFMDGYSEILNDMTEFDSLSLTPSVKIRLKEILNYNTVGTNFIPSHLLLYCCECIEKYYGKLNPEEKDLVIKLAWCLQIMIISSYMMDDMLDNSEYRSNRRTWHTLNGSQSICDIYLLLSCVYKLIEKYFSQHKNYSKIFQIFIGSGFESAIGETFQHELKSSKSFTIENFETTALLKTSIAGFVAPFKLACSIFHREDCMEDENCTNLMKELGICYQIQNDYWDCFGETRLGKTGNDIQENVCSVLIAVALQKADEDQKKILLENYGHNDSDRIERVKKIYKDLELKESFYELFEKRRNNLDSIILKIEDDTKRSLMEHISNKIYAILSKKN